MEITVLVAITARNMLSYWNILIMVTVESCKMDTGSTAGMDWTKILYIFVFSQIISSNSEVIWQQKHPLCSSFSPFKIELMTVNTLGGEALIQL